VKNGLRDLRASLNLTQADLAEKLGVSRQTVNAIETEKYDPSLPLALKIVKILQAGRGDFQSINSTAEVGLQWGSCSFAENHPGTEPCKGSRKPALEAVDKDICRPY